MNTLIKATFVIASIAISFASNAAIDSEMQLNSALTEQEVVSMLGDDMKMNKIELKKNISFKASKPLSPKTENFGLVTVRTINTPSMIMTVSKR
ncbi:MAG: hypothetical protein HRU25_01825 [Psychrobium sp.]|nr:hypothetical protein [Psychrobium sp.]